MRRDVLEFDGKRFLMHSVRKALLVAYKQRCQYCCQKIGYREASVDHIDPWFTGGKTELDNLTLSCRSCNSRKYWHEVKEPNRSTLIAVARGLTDLIKRILIEGIPIGQENTKEQKRVWWKVPHGSVSWVNHPRVFLYFPLPTDHAALDLYQYLFAHPKRIRVQSDCYREIIEYSELILDSKDIDSIYQQFELNQDSLEERLEWLGRLHISDDCPNWHVPSQPLPTLSGIEIDCFRSFPRFARIGVTPNLRIESVILKFNGSQLIEIDAELVEKMIRCSA